MWEVPVTQAYRAACSRRILWEAATEMELGTQELIGEISKKSKGEGMGLGRGYHQGMQTPMALPNAELQI